MDDAKPNQDEQVEQAMATLREIHAVFSTTPTQEMRMPTPVSHVPDYAEDEKRLVAYGSQTINNRCFQFILLSGIKAYWNIQMYLDGVAAGNALQLPAAARAQIELFALVWHVRDVVDANGGLNRPDLAKRMLAVDAALINALDGTRSDEINAIYSKVELSKLRPTNQRDMEVFKAKNILTRIEKSEKGSAYKTCSADYDRLSDLLHPNCMQNLIFMIPRSDSKGGFTLGLRNPRHGRRAQKQTVHAMVNASWQILQLTTDFPNPFVD
jgi:hypothetical protein